MSNKLIFKEEDYNSGDGMVTSIWGPPMWHVIHTISFNYPVNPTKEQMNEYFAFFNNIQNILPCKFCRDNLKKYLINKPLKMSIFKNRTTLSRWVYDLHEYVNTMLGKKSNLTFEEVRDRFEGFRARCLLNPSKKDNPNNKLEKGCTEPLYGVKAQCVLNIVPRNSRKKSLKIDPKCTVKKGGKCKD
jgi:hypothetical protein